jgi:hypothetical protein
LKEVIVYVEGPSDQLGMRKLLANIIAMAKQTGNIVDFFPMGGKEALLNKGPKKAINILRNKPNSWVLLVPDLYPPNKPFPHVTFQNLKNEIELRFIKELAAKNADERLKDRFRVHCFKYDLEVLLLASEDTLLSRLGVTVLSQKWKLPVEDQNHQRPPKRIVENLFSEVGKRYKDTIDVPWILERSDYNDLKTKCPQNFEPFIDDLVSILELHS